MEFIEAAQAFVNASKAKTQSQKGAIDNATVIAALTGWLDTEICEYTEGSSEAVSRRLGWLFPNNYSLTVGYEITPTISFMGYELLNEDSPIPFEESMDADNWSFVKHANGWQRNEHMLPEELAEFIENITEEVGKPDLILPWESRIEQTEEDEDPMEYYRESDSEELYQAFTNLMLAFSSQAKEQTQKIVPWEIVICYGDDYMPEMSDYNRFFSFANFLEETGEWLVNLDEHCAACSSGTRKWALESNPSLADKPEFLTWGQNTQMAYLPNGSIYVEVYLGDDEEAERFLKQHAYDYGFNLGDWEGDLFEAEGEVCFES